MKILFVCQGNVARSQMAEVYYNFFTKSNDASSAGVSASAPSKYVHPVEYIVQVMREDNIDISQKMVKLITKEMVDRADKIFIMCEKEECPGFLISSNKIIFWIIEDPFNTPMKENRKIRNEIKEKVIQLIEHE